MNMVESNEIILANKYILKKKIYDGRYSKVYIGKNKFKNEEVIIKLEDNKYSNMLQHEANIYLHLMKVKNKIKLNIPSFKFFGIIDKYDYIILEKMEYSLKDVIDNQNITINTNDILKILIQMIDVLKKFHSQNLIHRDIKPENIIFDKKGKIYLIDFGISTMFKENIYGYNTTNTYEYKKYVESKGKNKFIGNLIYASPYIHAGYDYFPKDDLISLSYVVLMLYYKKLPWTIFKYLKNEKLITENLKKSIDLIDFYKKYHNNNYEECKKVFFIEIYYYVSNLIYSDEIKYDELKIKLLNKIPKDEINNLYNFSWNKDIIKFEK